MNCRLTLGSWEQQRMAAQEVRLQVFVLEQKIPPELEWDAMDAASLHAVAYDAAGQAIGTGRLLLDGHIGRMAVSKTQRGQGIGGTILQTLMAQAKQRGDPAVLLHAQIQVEGFYRRFGFVRCGAEFSEAGILHLPMQCRF